MNEQQIITFWFEEITPAQWWQKSDEFDAMLKERFSALHQQAINCELSQWRNTSLGRLAEIIVIDQFSRNIYRDTPQAFIHDPLALALAQEAVSNKADDDLSEPQRNFCICRLCTANLCRSTSRHNLYLKTKQVNIPMNLN